VSEEDKERERSKKNRVPLASLIDWEDAKRRVLRLSLSPKGDLVAAADSLGRVTLYDVRVNAIVRMWKGVRDARMAWSSEGSNNSDENTDSVINERLSLAIYAPLLGVLTLYAMRHGPCLRVLPVGPQCQIFTTIHFGHARARCFLARADHSNGGGGGGTFKMKVVVTVIDPYQVGPEDFDPIPTPTPASSSSLNDGMDEDDCSYSDTVQTGDGLVDTPGLNKIKHDISQNAKKRREQQAIVLRFKVPIYVRV
jgi:hypothetical protein